jgi:hypothetical protein
VRENLGDFWKSITKNNVSFPTTACPHTFHKTNVLHNDLKKDAINEFGIKYWTSNPVWNMGASFTWILKKKYDYWWKKYWLDKTDALFDRNWAISLKPRRKSRPLHLVWWALVLCIITMKFISLSKELELSYTALV